MFRITKNPSLGSLIQYLTKITVVVLSCPLTWTQSVLWQHILSVVRVCSSPYRRALPTKCLPIQRTTHSMATYSARGECVQLTVQELHASTTDRICCHNTDHVHVNGHDRTILVILAKYCIRLPDDGSLVIRNMLEHF